MSFRYYTIDKARELQLSGYVRNMPDDSVEAVFQGSETAIHDIIDWCRRGPVMARVETVNVEEVALPEAYGEFKIRYD